MYPNKIFKVFILILILTNSLDAKDFNWSKIVKKLGWIGLAYNKYLNAQDFSTKNYSHGIYTGEIKNNEPCGKGTFIYSKAQGLFKTGDEYVGEYLNGRKHGIGVWRHKNSGKKEKCFYKIWS